MQKYSNYTPDGAFYISTSNPRGQGWETVVFQADRSTGKVNYSYALDEIASDNEEAAFATHQKLLWKWSGDAHPDDVLGVGEGYYQDVKDKNR